LSELIGQFPLIGRTTKSAEFTTVIVIFLQIAKQK